MVINAIIFDLGGIIVDLHQDRVVNAFADIFKLDSNTIQRFSESDAFKEALFAYERGQIDFLQFHAALNHTLNSHSDVEAFKAAWLSMIGHVPKHRFETLKTLRTNGIALYLFSNTCPEHIEYFLEQHHGFEDYFDSVYYSYAIGHRKPDAEGFRYILENHSLDANETLFVDDMLENIAGAKRLAIHGLHLPSNEGISLHHFREYL